MDHAIRSLLEAVAEGVITPEECEAKIKVCLPSNRRSQNRTFSPYMKVKGRFGVGHKQRPTWPKPAKPGCWARWR